MPRLIRACASAKAERSRATLLPPRPVLAAKSLQADWSGYSGWIDFFC
jgi:hypothetical protein